MTRAISRPGGALALTVGLALLAIDAPMTAQGSPAPRIAPQVRAMANARGACA